MKLSAPGKPLFLVSLVLFAIALLGALGVAIPVIGGYTIWIALGSWVALAIGCLMTGM